MKIVSFVYIPEYRHCIYLFFFKHSVKLRIKTDAKQFDVQEDPEDGEEPIQQQNEDLEDEEEMVIDQQV